MALESGVESKLNPNAPLFIPAAVRQLEDFSPEWWSLVTTSSWFRDYWLNQNQEESYEQAYGLADDDVIELLPEDIDYGVDEDILNMEAQFEEFLQLSESDSPIKLVEGVPENGFNVDLGALVKSLSIPKERAEGKFPKDVTKQHCEKPAKHVSPKGGPRFIHQPR